MAIASACLVVVLAACGSTTSAGAGAGTPTSQPAPAATLATSIPAGTTLRVGDQLQYLQTVLHLAGQDKGFPYKLEYSAFIGGPPMLQAFQGGSIDAGFVGSTPLIFAQAAGQPIVAVAGWASPHGSYSLLSKPGDTQIHSWSDIKGKKVAYQQGTAAEAVVLEQLDKAGLKLSDITSVNLVQTQVSAALQSGSADAGVEVEPLTSVYLQANPSATQTETADAITDRSSFLIASAGALGDPGTSAALGDYLHRLVLAFNWLRAHPGAAVQAIYVDQYHLTPARAAVVAKATGIASFVALPGQVVPAQQRLADLFHQAGEIPKAVDVSREFDLRYNQLVLQAQGQGATTGTTTP